jgi:pimeloyl-ACP methyl ester carboxylesterase
MLAFLANLTYTALERERDKRFSAQFKGDHDDPLGSRRRWRPAACARMGQCFRSIRLVHSRLVAESSLLVEAVRERACRVLPSGRFSGPGLLNVVADATAEDFPTNIRGMRQFLHNCTVKPLAPDDFERALCWNIIVRPDVRGALGRRVIDSDDVLSTLRVPLLVAHGRKDIIIKPAIAEHILEICPTATASWYDDVGHAPFLEDPARFNRELAELVHRVRP